MRSFLVLVRVAGILVEIEAAIRPAIDPKLDRSGRLLIGELNFRSKRKNGTGTYIDGKAVERSVCVDLPASRL